MAREHGAILYKVKFINNNNNMPIETVENPGPRNSIIYCNNNSKYTTAHHVI